MAISERQRELGMIIQDMETYVARLEGAPATGETMAEIHATFAATIIVLASIVLSMLPDEG